MRRVVRWVERKTDIARDVCDTFFRLRAASCDLEWHVHREDLQRPKSPPDSPRLSPPSLPPSTSSARHEDQDNNPHAEVFPENHHTARGNGIATTHTTAMSAVGHDADSRRGVVGST